MLLTDVLEFSFFIHPTHTFYQHLFLVLLTPILANIKPEKHLSTLSTGIIITITRYI
jgi:hypothetical protein